VRTLSIRTHLLLLVLGVCVPLVSVVGLGIYSDMYQTVAKTKTSLRMVASTMISNTGGKIADARQILDRLAARPLVKKVDPKNCDGVLQELHSLNLGYTNISYTDLDGVMLCAAVPQAGGKPVNFGKAPWFQKFLKERRFIVGLPYLGPITGKWVSVLNAPIWNEHEELVGSTQLPLDLAAFDPHIPAQFLPIDSRYGFISEDGTLIWRNQDPDHLIGTRPDTNVSRQIALVRDGEFENTATDGVTRFYSVMQMPETGWIAFVGVPVSTVYAQAKQRAKVAMTISLAAMGLLILFAIAISQRIAKPVVELEKAAHAVEGGNLEVRASTEGPSEIAAVAHGFNTMIEAQRNNVDALKHHVEQLRVPLGWTRLSSWPSSQARVCASFMLWTH
jgi:HAMP domain-containing protein